MQIKCDYCGAMVDETAERCPNCGAPLSGDNNSKRHYSRSCFSKLRKRYIRKHFDN